jgi:hypothetical protein
MNRGGFLAVLMIISALVTVNFLTGSAQSVGNTVLTVSPSQLFVNYLVDYPTSFTVNVSLTDVVDLSFWHVKLLFNPSILACSNVVEPPDGIFHGLDTIGLGMSIDNTAGYVGAYDGLWTTSGGVNGSGTLCRIRFDVKQPGISSIAFTDLSKYGGTIIYGSAQFPNSLPFSAINGYVQVNSVGFNANTFQAIKESVAYNVVMFTNSTVSDFGYDQNSDAITYVQTGPSGSDGSCSVLIPNGLMNVSYFGILIDGNATYFTLFSDGANHFLLWTYDHSTAMVSILPTVAGDLNADRKTDMKDVAVCAYSFGSIPGTSRWNPITDVNGDVKTDMKDLAFVAKYFGLSYQAAQ